MGSIGGLSMAVTHASPSLSAIHTRSGDRATR